MTPSSDDAVARDRRRAERLQSRPGCRRATKAVPWGVSVELVLVGLQPLPALTTAIVL